jgi:hypothetical protein
MTRGRERGKEAVEINRRGKCFCCGYARWSGSNGQGHMFHLMRVKLNVELNEEFAADGPPPTL